MAFLALRLSRARKSKRNVVHNVADASSSVDESLRQALKDFQDALEPKQRKRLTSSTIPDPEAVIILTTEIDNENAKRRSRCVAARISSFLESVQQFSSIVNAFVSSDPQIAGLVWGSVK
ncbi:hypothetical protein VTN00DRAFT_2524 [Thermoascus crustaceus]|uniref:uncharacterized protein n=1 Tax=Thermoascus crustaceus TaxID=5088 RepID=UPI00374255D8